ncbi:uncharacterized protein EI90DRAFT_3020441 [Cantharellus anzutake]|uniref:uncharacterized protein n=1 Tax=Cantharellus anzutake TaxID=1750568 RepID=UPI001905008B|nr:uncharacterized protein EI90DRAFT_3020441 [Cantharellus anzutake]KAF8321039.1 hypothetical protein EI90DRAFT_3020441 [Cantharellus anzutake]
MRSRPSTSSTANSEALSFVKESVKLRRQLVPIHPGSYTPNLAMSLNNLHIRSRTGFEGASIHRRGRQTLAPGSFHTRRHSEALLFIEECVQIRRQLVVVNPRAHAPGLAKSLNNLYSANSDGTWRHFYSSKKVSKSGAS